MKFPRGTRDKSYRFPEYKNFTQSGLRKVFERSMRSCRHFRFFQLGGKKSRDKFPKGGSLQRGRLQFSKSLTNLVGGKNFSV